MGEGLTRDVPAASLIIQQFTDSTINYYSDVPHIGMVAQMLGVEGHVLPDA